MQKIRTELIIIGFICLILSFVIPNMGRPIEAINWPSASEFLVFFIGTFALLSVMYFSNKPKEKLAKIADGFQTLYNDQGQVTFKGSFWRGKLINGKKYTYTKKGELLKTETFKDGIRSEVEKNS